MATRALIGRAAGWIATVAAVALLAACGATAGGSLDGSASDAGSDGGGTGAIYSCTVSQSDGARTYNFICIEGTPALRPQLQAQCAGPDAGPPATGVSNTGHFGQTPCPHDGAVGGCRTTFGGNSQTSWYYAAAGFTAAQVQQVCTAASSTFVAP